MNSEVIDRETKAVQNASTYMSGKGYEVVEPITQLSMFNRISAGEILPKTRPIRVDGIRYTQVYGETPEGDGVFCLMVE